MSFRACSFFSNFVFVWILIYTKIILYQGEYHYTPEMVLLFTCLPNYWLYLLIQPANSVYVVIVCLLICLHCHLHSGGTTHTYNSCREMGNEKMAAMDRVTLSVLDSRRPHAFIFYERANIAIAFQQQINKQTEAERRGTSKAHTCGVVVFLKGHDDETRRTGVDWTTEGNVG